MEKSGSIMGGALLVAGTSIGGGMLALPILTGQGGFVPSLAVFITCWLFMVCTGLLFLEISLWMDKEANIISMAQKTLGPLGKAFAWGLYLFLFYCLTVAYVVGCGNLLCELFQNSLPDWAGPLLFVALFAPFVYAGTKVIGKLNIFLMLGLGASFFAFVILGYSHVEPENLVRKDWSLSFLALPIAFTSFAYQGIIPSLITYMHHDARKTRQAILIGSFIPFLTYLLWQWLIMGIVPADGPYGLTAALANGSTAIQPLKYFIDNPSIFIIAKLFAFFALVTSFFGVTLGLLDFLADGLRVEKTKQGRLLLCFGVFVPPMLIAYTHPHVFLSALDFAGGFGCALLLGLLPILMVWRGRYFLKLPSTYSIPGGKPLLIILLLFVVFELVCETMHKFIH
jgi:tyrosine-specific transport protein